MKSYQWLLFLSLFSLNLALMGCEGTGIGSQKREEVAFYCETDSNGESVTKVKNGAKIQNFIVWRRTNFVKAGFPPQRRCEEVTPRLQKAYDNDTLKTLTWGYAEDDNLKKHKALCTTIGKDCHTLILTLLESDDPDLELKAFTAVLNGDASQAYQNSSCALNNSSRLSCTVDIFRLFKK
ncbi:COP23 domain-containing protein [Nostoc sp. NMS8]|uniref:COP23 domain-containing protein n=1 Tax=Nostoc sp. NMS8 TaxID=2815392 RepID=UPI0025FC65D4|nr:COP23 domain-containing protein [Nostoc sp. NMS8]MBN3959648.1 hypothetical protein [Nostoc sp. NMS8]